MFPLQSKLGSQVFKSTINKIKIFFGWRIKSNNNFGMMFVDDNALSLICMQIFDKMRIHSNECIWTQLVHIFMIVNENKPLFKLVYILSKICLYILKIMYYHLQISYQNYYSIWFSNQKIFFFHLLCFWKPRDQVFTLQREHGTFGRHTKFLRWRSNLDMLYRINYL